LKFAKLLFLILSATQAFALPEAELQADFSKIVLPFLATGKIFAFATTDGLKLSGVYFENPTSTKTIVIVNGRSEPWLKYGEVFYDLYQQGYSIYSYDHRGQGLSPHLSPVNPEIGHVEFFHSYIEDLNTFVTDVVIPNKKPSDDLFLFAHSMGGTVAAGYLSEYKVPFKKAVLSCPMLQVNTKPYPEPIARSIVDVASLLGKSEHYAIGYGDYNLDLPFSKNTTTGSPVRWWMTNEVYRENPSTLIGGPSNRWVHESLTEGQSVRNEMGNIEIPFILFQAGSDQIVKPKGEEQGCAKAGSLCTLIKVPDSQHEILFEKDAIRSEALAEIFTFFQ